MDTAATNVWITLLSGAASCVKPGGLGPLGGASPYTLEFKDQPAASYQILVETDPASSGTLTLNYPVASYDIRSQRDGQTITSRATASTSSAHRINEPLAPPPFMCLASSPATARPSAPSRPPPAPPPPRDAPVAA